MKKETPDRYTDANGTEWLAAPEPEPAAPTDDDPAGDGPVLPLQHPVAHDEETAPEPEPEIVTIMGKPYRVTRPGVFEPIVEDDVERYPSGRPKTFQFTLRGRAAHLANNQRRTELDDDLITALCLRARNGASIPDAAALCGISVHNVRSWLQDGARDLRAAFDSIFARFHLAWSAAQADYVQTLLEYANAGAASDGKLALDMLSRRRPQDWGKTDKLLVDVTRQQLVAQVAAEDGIDPAALEAEMQRLQKLGEQIAQKQLGGGQ